MNKARGFGLVELIITAVIVLFLAYFLMKRSLSNAVIDQENQKILTKEGISTGNPSSLIEESRKRVSDYNRQIEKREEGLSLDE